MAQISEHKDLVVLMRYIKRKLLERNWGKVNLVLQQMVNKFSQTSVTMALSALTITSACGFKSKYREDLYFKCQADKRYTMAHLSGLE